MSEQSPKPREHRNRAVEIGAAATIGAAAVSSAAYIIWRRQHREGRTYSSEIADYQRRLSIFDETRIKPEAVQTLLAPVAVQILYSTFNTAEQVITREQLLEQFRDVSNSHMQKALSYLKDKDYALIDRRPSTMNDRVQGYYSTPALNWAVEQGENETLLQAYADLVNRQFNGNS